jgi:hypothetical protein
MRLTTVWTGAPEEFDDLLNAIRRNCTCPSARPSESPACPAHALLLAAPPAINRLLFVRRLAARLRIEEWAPSENEERYG